MPDPSPFPKNIPAAEPVVFRWTVERLEWKKDFHWKSLPFDAFGERYQLEILHDAGARSVNPLASVNNKLNLAIYVKRVPPNGFGQLSAVHAKLFIESAGSRTMLSIREWALSQEFLAAGLGFPNMVDSAAFTSLGKPPFQITISIMLHSGQPTNTTPCIAHLCVRSHSHHQTGTSLSREPGIPMTPQFAHLLDSSDHADASFRIGNETIPAHVAILKFCAPDSYFSAIFAHNTREAISREVMVEDTSYESFYALLQFIYTGQCDVPDDMLTLVGLYRAADKYQITACAEMAKGELFRRLANVPIQQMCIIFETLLDMPDLDACKVLCLRNLLEHWERVQELDEWEAISSSAVNEIMRLTAVCTVSPMATAKAAQHPAHTSPTLAGRDDRPAAAMTGPSIGPRPAAIPTTITSTNISLANPSAIEYGGATASTGGNADITIPAPAALHNFSKEADKIKSVKMNQKARAPLAAKHPPANVQSTHIHSSAAAEPQPIVRAHPIPDSAFEESVYDLIPEVIPPAERAARYQSNFAGQARVEYRSGRKPWASMGVPHVEVKGKKTGPGEGEFLHKRDREVGVVDAAKYEPDRTIRKAPVPKEPGKIPSPPQKDFIKLNALDNINTPAKKPPPPPPSYLTKASYGRTPSYLVKRIHEDEERHAHPLTGDTIGDAVKRESLGMPASQSGLISLPEDERAKILEGLKKNWTKLNSDYQKLSLTVDTVPKISRKVNMEQQLKLLEDNIHKFSHPNILVNFAGAYAQRA
ncbi:hypothetical protein HDV00_007783 [Rhizophlyctis rosea]|nr:hypothetical protein HDV00_007783 [Rhizophlyctis rosea]